MTTNLPAAKPQTPKSTQLVFAEDGSLSMEDMGGAGFENVNETRDILIPRVTILQALSPQMQKSKPEYLPNARPGDICDTATGEIFAQPLRAVVVDYVVSYLEWAPRNSSKGLVAIYQDGSALPVTRPDERGRQVTEQGNLLVESRQFFCLLPDNGNRRVFIPMSSTQAKKAKRWITTMRAERRIHSKTGQEYNPPLFYRSHLLSSFNESNAEGSWEGWRIEPSVEVEKLPTSKATMKAIAEFYTVLKSGQVKAAAQEHDEVPF